MNAMAMGEHGLGRMNGLEAVARCTLWKKFVPDRFVLCRASWSKTFKV